MTAGTVTELKGGLVVSCQAPPGHPLRKPEVIAALSRCAELGGAAGVRVAGVRDVEAVRRQVEIPIIGIEKVELRPGRYWITPDLAAARALVVAGAAMVAVEVSSDPPTGVEGGVRLISEIHDRLGVPVMADVSSHEEAMLAWEGGADLVGTTLSGYTLSSAGADGPDLQLARRLAAARVRTVLEGRVESPAQVRAAFEAGVWAVTVGTAITNPLAITQRFVAAAGSRQPAR